MIDKIKEALKQSYKTLGLSDEVFERVATSVETFITEESNIDAYVKSESTANLLKSFQSVNDKLRGLEQKLKNEANRQTEQGEEKSEQTKESEEQQKEVKSDNATDLVSAMQAVLEKELSPLKEKLAAFEAEKSQKQAVASLDEFKSSWDWAKAYPDECADTYDHVMELYNALGCKWSSDELVAQFKNKFNKAVKRRGVNDTDTPFKSEGAVGDNELDTDEITKALQSRGNLPKNN